MGIERRHLATWWLHPQAIHGLPPINEAALKAIKLDCLQLKGRAGYHKPELGRELGLASGRQASGRQDLCDRLEARCGLRERETLKFIDYLCTDRLFEDPPGDDPWTQITDYRLWITLFPTLVKLFTL